MSLDLASISSNPTLRQYAFGASQAAMQPVADFLAPTVNVATSVGRYKRYDQKHQFNLVNTIRGVGGRAVEITFGAEDATYNCTPHAIDVPVDILEEIEASDLESTFRESADMAAEVGALQHEKTVIAKALAELSSPTAVDTATDDVIDAIDTAILDVVKAAKYGSVMGVGVLCGASAFRLMKNSDAIKSRFVQAGQDAYPLLSESGLSSMLMGTPEVRVAYMVEDTAGLGLAESISFLLDSEVIIFARKPNPTRRDPSFMKTFRLSSLWMQPGAYTRDDGRVQVAKFDWSEDVVVTNGPAAKRLTLS